MSEEQDEDRIRMKIVTELFEELDGVFVKFSNDHGLNFLEVETALTMLRKKLDWEQLKVWSQLLYNTKEDSNTSKNNGMYK